MEELSVAFINLINNIAEPFWILLFAIAAFLGLLWTIGVAVKMRRSTVPGATPVSMGEIAGVMIVAAFLSHYSSMLGAFSSSLGMGEITFGVISYADEGGDLGEFAGVINAALTFVMMMGGVFGIKGFYLLKQKVSGESKSGDLALQAFIHVFAGGLLVRIAQLLSALANSI